MDTTRRGVLLGTSVIAIVLVFASVAWACTVNMFGEIWFTAADASSDCTGSGAKSTAITAGSALAVVCSQSEGLAIGTLNAQGGLYELRYVPATTAVDDSTETGLCHNSPLILKNDSSADGLFHAQPGAHGSLPGEGGWVNQEVTLPAEQQSYVICAASVGAIDGGSVETGSWDATGSGHLLFTVVGPGGADAAPN